MRYLAALSKALVVALAINALSLSKAKPTLAFNIIEPPSNINEPSKGFALTTGPYGYGYVTRKNLSGYDFEKRPAPTAPGADILNFFNDRTSGYVFQPGGELSGSFLIENYYVCAPIQSFCLC